MKWGTQTSRVWRESLTGELHEGKKWQRGAGCKRKSGWYVLRRRPPREGGGVDKHMRLMSKSETHTPSYRTWSSEESRGIASLVDLSGSPSFNEDG